MAEESVTIRLEGSDAGATAVLQNLQKQIEATGASGAKAGNAIAAGLQAGINQILQMSRTIDITSKADVAALRANALGVRELATAAGVAPAEIQKLAIAEQVLDTRLRQVTQSTKLQAQALVGSGGNLDRINPKARTAANAFTQVAFAATSMTSGFQGGVIAAGTLATSLATLSTSATVAAGASGIGAILVVLGALLVVLNRVTHATADMSATLDLIKSASDVASIEGIRASIDTQLAAAQAKLDAFNKQTLKPPIQGAKLKAEVEGLTAAAREAYKQFVDLLGAEGERAGEKATAEAKRLAEKAVQDAKHHAEQVAAAEKSALRDQESLANEAVQNQLRAANQIEQAELAAAVATRSRRRADVQESLASEQSKANSLIAIDEAYHAQLDAIKRASAERQRRLTLEEFSDRRSGIAADLANARAEIENQAAQGLISERDAEREIAAVERARIPALQQLVIDMRAFGEATKDPDVLRAAEQLSAQIGSLGIERSANRAAVAIANFKDDAIDAVAGDLSQFLGSTINQVNSFGDAWRELARSAIQSIQQIIAQLISLRAAQILTGLFAGGVSASGGASATQLGTSGIPTTGVGPMPLVPIHSLNVTPLSLRDFSALQIPSFSGSAASAGPSGFTGGTLTVEVVATDDHIVRVMKSPPGVKVHITNLAQNKKTVNAALGR